MRRRYEAIFLKAAGAILLLTGAAKVLSGLGHARVLALPDPILGLPFRELMLVAGAGEVAVALACFFPAAQCRIKLGLVAWTATNFVVYRFGLRCVGWHHPCSCMGSLAGALHLSDRAADNIMKGVFAFLLVGSYLLSHLDWRARRAAGPPTGLVPG